MFMNRVYKNKQTKSQHLKQKCIAFWSPDTRWKQINVHCELCYASQIKDI